MVSLPSPELTKVGFRRDIKLFLASLVGFLVFVILVLLVLLQVFEGSAEESVRKHWATIGRMSVESLSDLGSNAADTTIESRLVYLRGKFSIPSIEVKTRRGTTVRSGFTGSRTEPYSLDSAVGRVTFRFDAAPVLRMRRLFLVTAGVCFAATIIGTILLLLYLPKIVRPIEELLDQASELGERGSGVEETHYLIETFRRSIDTLKLQEAELKQLHEMEKSRADDLQRVTATLTRSLSSGFIALTAEGKLVDVNGAAREILRIAPERELPGLSLSEALGETAFTRVLSDAFEARATLTRTEIEDERPEAVTIGLTTVPLIDEESRFAGMLALFTDLTPVRSLELRLREMQTFADLGEISAGIAHEFRNSLSTILGYLKLAKKQTNPEDAGTKIAHAEKEAALLSSAVERLLHFARPMKLDAQPTPLRSLVESIVERFRESDPSVDFAIEGPDIEIEGDATLLRSAIENLVRNGCDSIRMKGADGRVEITIDPLPVPTITIRDDGIGFDPITASRLFLPFQSNKPSGMGLGLPLAKKIVLLHGGTLRLVGTPSRGAVATIEFP